MEKQANVLQVYAKALQVLKRRFGQPYKIIYAESY